MARPIVHGMSKTTEFKIWQGIHQRCYNPNFSKYYLYGGRGIKVEDKRWFSFMEFYNDMGKRPKGLSLDRIDGSKGYCKENCRWATIKQQNVNRRNVVLMEYNGVTKPMKEWGDNLGISFQLIRYRVKRGLTTAQVLETPVKKYNKSL